MLEILVKVPNYSFGLLISIILILAGISFFVGFSIDKPESGSIQFLASLVFYILSIWLAFGNVFSLREDLKEYSMSRLKNNLFLDRGYLNQKKDNVIINDPENGFNVLNYRTRDERIIAEVNCGKLSFDDCIDNINKNQDLVIDN